MNRNPEAQRLTDARERGDHIPFYEYFHGDNGAGIGASHQTGWTGLVAKLLQLFGTITPQTVLSQGARGAGALPVPP
jgi:hypothetical protein